MFVGDACRSLICGQNDPFQEVVTGRGHLRDFPGVIDFDR